MEQALKSAFSALGYTVPDALTPVCISYINSYKLSPDDLASKYEVFCMNSGNQSRVSQARLDSFKDYLASEAGKENRVVAKPSQVRPRDDSSVVVADDKPAKRQATVIHSPLQAALSPSLTPSAKLKDKQSGENTKFAARTNKRQVVGSYNGNSELKTITNKQLVPSVVRIVGGDGVLVDTTNTQIKYMVENFDDKAAAIEQRIRHFATALKSTLGQDMPGDLDTPVNAMSQEEVVVVGQIVSDNESGIINEQSVLLEGCRAVSEGARVKLDLTRLPAYRLFPGQIVAVRGVNPSCHTFIAHHIWTHVPPKSPLTLKNVDPAAAGATPAGAGGGEVQSVVVACGPFSCNDDLSFDPLKELLAYCKELRVGCLVLLGPLLDTEHPQVKTGDLDDTFARVYQREVLWPLNEWQQQPDVQCSVVLVPSLRDVHHTPVFPQPPFNLAGMASEHLLSAPNPSSVLCGHLSMAAVTHDVLRHLSAAETSRGPAPERLMALASHIIGQQSFYPLNPPTLGACLDTSRAASLALRMLPHLLLLPSDLAPMAKILSLDPAILPGLAAAPAAQNIPPPQVMVLNPGRLVKGSSGGTFAHVWSRPAANGDAARPELQVDIVRI